MLCCLDELKKSFTEHYNYTVSLMSDPFISGRAYKNIEGISFETSRFLSEIEQKIQSFNYIIPNDTLESFNKMKNNFIDKLFPEKEYRGSSKYNQIMQLKAKAANMLEDMLLAAYKTGAGAKELSVKEKDAIDEKWSKKCENDINHAYSTGTKTLALALKAAVSNEDAMKLLNK